MEENNNQSILEEMEKEELELQARKKHIADIFNSDNYIEEMQKLNVQLNKTRKNKKVVNYNELKKFTDSEGEQNGKQ